MCCLLVSWFAGLPVYPAVAALGSYERTHMYIHVGMYGVGDCV